MDDHVFVRPRRRRLVTAAAIDGRSLMVLLVAARAREVALHRSRWSPVTRGTVLNVPMSVVREGAGSSLEAARERKIQLEAPVGVRAGLVAPCTAVHRLGTMVTLVTPRVVAGVGGPDTHVAALAVHRKVELMGELRRIYLRSQRGRR